MPKDVHSFILFYKRHGKTQTNKQCTKYTIIITKKYKSRTNSSFGIAYE